MQVCTQCIFGCLIAAMTQENLRDKKRRETLAAIYGSAARLVAARGYGSVTVDEICTQVGISKRTFFNYCDSKEQAVIGPGPRTLSENERAAFLAEPHPALLADLLDLHLTTVIDGMGADEDILRHHRKQIMHRNHGLAAQRNAQMMAALGSLTELTREALSCEQERAEAITALVSTSMYLGHHRWLQRPHANYGVLREECARALDQLAAAMKEYS